MTANGQACTVPGRHITGALFATEQQRDKTKGDKTYPGKFLVKVVDGNDLLTVEFADQATAEQLVPGLANAERGQPVTVAFGVRSAQGYTFYFGRRGG